MKAFFILSALSATTLLCSCSSDIEEIDSSPESMTRAVKAAQVVWEAQPGTINVPQGQAVTITLDGQVIKN